MEAYFIFHANHNERILSYLGMVFALNIYDAADVYAKECDKRNEVAYVTATFCDSEDMRLIGDSCNNNPEWFCGWTINFTNSIRG